MSDFHLLIENIVSKYDSVCKENAELKSIVANLQAQLAQLKNVNFTGPQQLGNNTEKPKDQPRKLSAPFWQPKRHIKTEWSPVPIVFPDSLLSVHVSNHDIIAFGSADSTITLYSASEKQQLSVVTGHRGAVNCIVSDPVTGLFASCSGDGNVNIWSPPKMSEYTKGRKSNSDKDVISASAILSHHCGTVNGAVWIDNDGHLVSGSSDATLCLWDVTHSGGFVKSDDLKSGILGIDFFSQDMPIIATCHSNGEIMFLDQRTPKSCVVSCIHGKCSVVNVKYLKSAVPLLVSGGTDNKLKQWDIRSPNEPILETNIDRVPTKFDICGDLAIVPCEIGHVRVIDLGASTVNILEPMPFSYTVSSAAFIDAKGKTIVAASWDGSAATCNINIQ